MMTPDQQRDQSIAKASMLREGKSTWNTVTGARTTHSSINMARRHVRESGYIFSCVAGKNVFAQRRIIDANKVEAK